MASMIDYKEEREKDVKKILDSTAFKKIIVAGPGTGKSYLFEQAIKNEKKKGKNNFLAITFVGRLCDSLADNLAGLAKTYTLHGFSRKFVLDNTKGWNYYPKVSKIIKEDLKINGINSFEIGDNNYIERSKYYRVIGDDDVILYAIKICEKTPDKIPIFDLILVDEFQDFNETEAKLIDILATKNKILIVGDDDQALYDFKGSFSKYIKEKYSSSNKDFESHTLRFCSRCTEVIVNSFHDLVNSFSGEGKLLNRICDKEYLCYLPDKQEDNNLNQYLHVWTDIAPGMIASKIRNELNMLLTGQKIKTVLIIGEARTCQTILKGIANKLIELGFKNVNYSKKEKNFSFREDKLHAYKLLAIEKNQLLAWRLIINELDGKIKEKIIKNNFSNGENFLNAIPINIKNFHEKNVNVLKRIMKGPWSDRKKIAKSSIDGLKKQIVENEMSGEETFTRDLIKQINFIERPLANLDITVCSILGAKGLGADVVFLVGFDQGRFPFEKEPVDSEIFQMLVSLTRANKRIYLINTKDKPISSFLNFINKKNYKITTVKI